MIIVVLLSGSLKCMISKLRASVTCVMEVHVSGHFTQFIADSFYFSGSIHPLPPYISVA
jgi:hypothetical protein